MPKALLLFAHGAGAPSSSPWMQRWAQRLRALGHVVTFDYPYMKAGRRSPDPHKRLVEAHQQALEQARQGHRGPVILVGKSMGGCIGCHLALQEPVQALVCLGYPLKAASKTGAVRDEVLMALRTPVLFVQGSRDALCPLELLQQVRQRMQAPNELHVVQGGNHSLELTKTQLGREGLTQEQVDGAAFEAIEQFVRRVVG